MKIITVNSEVQNILGHWVCYSDNNDVINFGKSLYSVCLNDENCRSVQNITFDNNKNCINIYYRNNAFNDCIIKIPFNLIDHVLLLLPSDIFEKIPIE